MDIKVIPSIEKNITADSSLENDVEVNKNLQEELTVDQNKSLSIVNFGEHSRDLVVTLVGWDYIVDGEGDFIVDANGNKIGIPLSF